ncbi:MAG: D-alanine--D-alanine ligase [bacterium]|nr:D-alanine--D-alanine ligase [bacterium]
MKSKQMVAVVFGGKSSEREVSLKSGAKVVEHIPTNKYDVLQYDPLTDLPKLVNDILDKKVDIVFPVLHGKFGEDGTIQGLCEILDVPYVGPGVKTSAICMDKIATKRMIMTQGTLTPEFEVMYKGDEMDLRNIELPCVIKPGNAGSSVGITIPESFAELKNGIKKAFDESDEILVENFIDGREFTVGVIGTHNNIQVLPATEIIPNVSKFYDFAAKYDEGGSTHVCPADLDEETTETLQRLGERAFRVLGASGMMRVDFMYDESEKLFYFIEANTIPGMTNTSLLPEAAAAAGIEFSQLLDKLIQFGFERYQEEQV